MAGPSSCILFAMVPRTAMLLLACTLVTSPAKPLARQAVESRAKSPGGIVVPAVAWETLTSPYVEIRHVAKYRADAELYANFIRNTHLALRTEFSTSDVDALARTPVPCTVWLHPQASSAINAGSALASTAYGLASVCELHFLTPGAYAEADQCCTKVGERRSLDQLHRVASHEYSTVVLDRLTRSRGGWRFHDAPEWFEQGYEEYLGCMIASEDTRTITLGKYRELLTKEPRRLRGTSVENPSIDGTALLQMLHERFGPERVRAILFSPATTFDDAFREAIGMSQLEFFEIARAALAQGR
jgi:hypothetical protein